jgi:hypothetical protein
LAHENRIRNLNTSKRRKQSFFVSSVCLCLNVLLLCVFVPLR